jgi:hypothetical protein
MGQPLTDPCAETRQPPVAFVRVHGVAVDGDVKKTQPSLSKRLDMLRQEEAVGDHPHLHPRRACLGDEDGNLGMKQRFAPLEGKVTYSPAMQDGESLAESLRIYPRLGLGIPLAAREVAKRTIGVARIGYRHVANGGYEQASGNGRNAGSIRRLNVTGQ